MTKTSQENTPPVIALSELYLARRTAIELIRDTSASTRGRINEAFAREIIMLLKEAGIDLETECARLDDASEDTLAAILRSYLPFYAHPPAPVLPHLLVGEPKSTVSSPSVPSRT